MWIFDKLFNRKIEGKSSLDNLENLAGKVEYEGDKVKFKSDVEVEGLTSKGIANTGNFANIGNGAFTGTVSAKNVVEEGDTELIDLSSYVNSDLAKSHSLYAKLLVKHGMLHIVVSGDIVCKGTAASNVSLLNNFFSALPEGIGSKIYRADGSNITQTASSSAALFGAIAGITGFKFGSGLSSTQQPYLLQSNEANSIGIQFRPAPAFTEDLKLFVDCRFALTI